MIVAGAVLTAFALIAVVANSPLAGIGTAGVLLLVMGLWKQNGDYVSLYSDYLTAKPAPAAGRKAILYSEIVAVIHQGQRLVIEYRPHTDSPDRRARRVTLRLGALEPAPREAFIDQLGRRLPAGIWRRE